MNLTPYNQRAAIEMLRARAFLLLMSEEVASLDGPNASALFAICGDMTEADALSAVAAWDATQ